MLDRATLRELGWYKQTRGRGSHKQAVIRRMQATEEWTPKERMATGIFLVYMLAKHTGLVADRAGSQRQAMPPCGQTH